MPSLETETYCLVCPTGHDFGYLGGPGKKAQDPRLILRCLLESWEAAALKFEDETLLILLVI